MNKLLLLIIALALNACIFNDSILPDSDCVTKILIGEMVVSEVKYNKQNRPVEIIDSRLTDQFTTTIAYKKGKISQIIRDSYSGKNTSDVVFLTDNKVQITNHLRQDDVEYLIELKNNLPVRIRRWWKSTPDARYESIFFYDSNDNLQKTELYELNTLTSTVEYNAFDDKKNFYYGNPVDWIIISVLQTINYGALSIPISKNNPLSYKTTYEIPSPVRSYDYSFVYQYNDRGYPIAARPADMEKFELFIEYKK